MDVSCRRANRIGRGNIEDVVDDAEQVLGAVMDAVAVAAIGLGPDPTQSLVFMISEKPMTALSGVAARGSCSPGTCSCCCWRPRPGRGGAQFRFAIFISVTSCSCATERVRLLLRQSARPPSCGRRRPVGPCQLHLARALRIGQADALDRRLIARRRGHVEEMLADDFGGVLAQHALGYRIDRSHLALVVDHQQAVELFSTTWRIGASVRRSRMACPISLQVEIAQALEQGRQECRRHRREPWQGSTIDGRFACATSAIRQWRRAPRRRPQCRAASRGSADPLNKEEQHAGNRQDQPARDLVQITVLQRFGHQGLHKPARHHSADRHPHHVTQFGAVAQIITILPATHSDRPCHAGHQQRKRA